MDMKKVVVWICFALMSTSVLAAGFMGPPTAELEQGQWNMGYSYAHADMDLEPTNLVGYGLEIDNGVVVVGPNPWSEAMKIEDFKIHRHYFTIGYGLTKTWEIYALLGTADVKAKYYKEGEWDSLNFDNDFAWGWGTRKTLSEQDNVKWGVSAQMNWLDTSSVETEVTSEYVSKITIDIKSYDLLLAFGPTVEMGSCKLYGGPFYYYLNGDFDRLHTSTFGTYVYLGKGSADMEADSNFGGFLGGQFSLGKNTDWTTEFSSTGDSWAVGTGITWKF
jgi:hypothetical protein